MEFYFPVIRLIDVRSGMSSPSRSIPTRENNILLIKTSGTTIYYLPNESWSLSENDVLLIPEGFTYSVKTLVPGGFISIIFESDTKIEKAIKFHFPQGVSYFKKLFRCANSPMLSDRIRLGSMVYEIIYKASSGKESNYLSSYATEIVNDAATEIEKRYADNSFRLSFLCEKYAVSKVYLCKLFQSLKGMTLSKYLAQIRLNKAKELLSNGVSVTEAAYAVGFCDPLYFSKFFKKNVGCSPTFYLESYIE